MIIPILQKEEMEAQTGQKTYQISYSLKGEGLMIHLELSLVNCSEELERGE